MKTQDGKKNFVVTLDSTESISPHNSRKSEELARSTDLSGLDFANSDFNDYALSMSHLESMVYPFTAIKGSFDVNNIKLGGEERLLFSIINYIITSHTGNTYSLPTPHHSVFDSFKLPGISDFVKFFNANKDIYEIYCANGGLSRYYGTRLDGRCLVSDKSFEKECNNPPTFKVDKSGNLYGELKQIKELKDDEDNMRMEYDGLNRTDSDTVSTNMVIPLYGAFKFFDDTSPDVCNLSTSNCLGNIGGSDIPLSIKIYAYSFFKSILEEYRNVCFLYASEAHEKDSLGWEPKEFAMEWQSDNVYYRMFKERVRLLQSPIELVEVGEECYVPMNNYLNPDGLFLTYLSYAGLSVRKNFTGSHLIYSFIQQNPSDLRRVLDATNLFKSCIEPWLDIVEESGVAPLGEPGFDTFFQRAENHFPEFVDSLVEVFDRDFPEKKDRLDISVGSQEPKVIQSVVLSSDLEIVENVSESGISIGDFARNYFA